MFTLSSGQSQAEIVYQFQKEILSLSSFAKGCWADGLSPGAASNGATNYVYSMYHHGNTTVLKQVPHPDNMKVGTIDHF